MKESSEYKEWQKDFMLLTWNYNISCACNYSNPEDVLVIIEETADSLHETLEVMLGKQIGEKFYCFLKTSASSILQLNDILNESLYHNLITIDKYHSLLTNLEKIKKTIQGILNFIIQKQNNILKVRNKISEGFTYWILN